MVASILVTLAAGLGIAVAGELACRWWIRRRGDYFVLPPGLRMQLHPDPEVFPQLERTTRFEVNAEGERGDEVPRGKEGLYRILVAGGSQPEGYLLDQETTWPGALQRLLQTPACLRRLGAARVHVGSIARSGVGSEALDLIFERVLPRYPRVQAIVILIGATDVMRWLEYGAADVTPPVRVADVFRCHPEGPFGWRPGRLAVGELLRRARRRWLRTVEMHHQTGRWIADARAMRARAKVVRSVMPDPSPMLHRFDIHFRHLLQRAKVHADRVIVVRQPWFDKRFTPQEAACMWHGGVGQAWRGEVSTYYSFEVFSALMSLLDARASNVATAMGVEQLDLMPVLERSLATYYDCHHMTPAGSRAVASLVGTAIVHGSGRMPATADAPPAAPAVSDTERDTETDSSRVVLRAS